MNSPQEIFCWEVQVKEGVIELNPDLFLTTIGYREEDLPIGKVFVNRCTEWCCIISRRTEALLGTCHQLHNNVFAALFPFGTGILCPLLRLWLLGAFWILRGRSPSPIGLSVSKWHLLPGKVSSTLNYNGQEMHKNFAFYKILEALRPCDPGNSDWIVC